MNDSVLALHVVNPCKHQLAQLRRDLSANRFCLEVCGDRLIFRQHAAVRLARCLKSLQSGAEKMLLALPGWCSLQVLMLEISRQDASCSASQPSFVVGLALQDAAALDLSGGLREALGLSESEASLALALAQGVSLDDYTEQQGLSKNTVRTQASVVRRKTGARSQAQIASLVWLTHQAQCSSNTPITRVLAENLVVASC